MSTLPAPSDPRWLLKTVFSRPRLTLPAAMCMSVSFLLNGSTPVIVGHALDEAVAQGSPRRLWFWVSVLVAAFGLNAIAAWWGRGLNSRGMLEVGHDVRMAIADRILDPRGIAGSRRSAGELLAIASTDAQRIQNAVMMTVFPVAEISAIVYVAVMASRVNLALGAAILCGGPLVVWGSLQAAKTLRARSGIRQAALAKASAMATDVVQGLRILKGLGAVTTVSKRYAAVSDAAFKRTIAANAAQARLNAITEILGSVYVIAVGIGAGFMALHSIISVGELITVIGLTQFIITPMTMLGRNIASRWAAAKASAERIRAVLAAPGVEAEEPQLPALAGGVNVLGEPAPADLEFLPRERFLVAPHETILFEGSVGDNIHPDDRVAQNALYVAAGEDIPGGLDREVGEAGRNLSGGQQQRVALARAIAANPEVLVLADPTTAVDSVTEYTIAQRVAEYRGSKTTLVFTTSPAWSAVGVRI